MLWKIHRASCCNGRETRGFSKWTLQPEMIKDELSISYFTTEAHSAALSWSFHSINHSHSHFVCTGVFEFCHFKIYEISKALFYWKWNPQTLRADFCLPPLFNSEWSWWIVEGLAANSLHSLRQPGDESVILHLLFMHMRRRALGHESARCRNHRKVRFALPSAATPAGYL